MVVVCLYFILVFLTVSVSFSGTPDASILRDAFDVFGREAEEVGGDYFDRRGDIPPLVLGASSSASTPVLSSTSVRQRVPSDGIAKDGTGSVSEARLGRRGCVRERTERMRGRTTMEGRIEKEQREEGRTLWSLQVLLAWMAQGDM